MEVPGRRISPPPLMLTRKAALGVKALGRAAVAGPRLEVGHGAPAILITGPALKSLPSLRAGAARAGGAVIKILGAETREWPEIGSAEVEGHGEVMAKPQLLARTARTALRIAKRCYA